MKPDNILGNLSNPQSFNRYTYVKGNPVNFNDPGGHMAMGNTGNTDIDYTPWSGTSTISDEKPEWWQVFALLVLDYGYEAAVNYVMNNDIDLNEEEEKDVLKLTAAQDEALTNPEFQQKDLLYGATFCNLATFSIVEAMNADETPFKYPDSGNVAVANDVCRYLSNDKMGEKWKQVPESKVQGLADRGKLVVGVSKNPGGHGHLVTARASFAVSQRYAGNLSSAKHRVIYQNKGEGPYIANIGWGKPWIGRAKENQFIWFTPKQ